MCIYDNSKIVIFGGAGPFLAAVEIRLSYNDIQIYDTKRKHWQHVEAFGKIPKKRCSHAAAVMGGVMLVHGGYNTEGKVTLDDFNLYDFGQHEWITTVTSTDGVILES